MELPDQLASLDPASSAHLYRTVLDQLYDGVYFVDPDRRIVYWNQSAETITGFSAAEVVGHKCADNILMHVDANGNNLCQGSCPLAQSLADGAPRAAEVYLHHKDGHRVPVHVRITTLRDSTGRVFGAAETFSENSTRLADLERISRLEQLAYLDSLTELANRRFAEMTIKTRFFEMERNAWPFGLVFVDIDELKRINDSYGHGIGDRVIQMVSSTLRRCSRSFDLAARWGGDELVAIVANIQPPQLTEIANRYQLLIRSARLALGPSEHGIYSSTVQVTVSVGATIARPGDTPETLIERADALLYQSKTAGRDRVSTDS